MNLEDAVRRAIVEELKRQSEARRDLTVQNEAEPYVVLNGRVDLDELSMAVVGAVAGGP